MPDDGIAGSDHQVGGNEFEILNLNMMSLRPRGRGSDKNCQPGSKHRIGPRECGPRSDYGRKLRSLAWHDLDATVSLGLTVRVLGHPLSKRCLPAYRIRTVIMVEVRLKNLANLLLFFIAL